MYVMNAAALDPANNVYFGSTKDSDGKFLSDVTVSLDTEATSYVMVTDDAGRFKIVIPKDILPSQVTFRCAKPGYVQLRAVTRPPPNKAISPMQADCVLGRKEGTRK